MKYKIRVITISIIIIMLGTFLLPTVKVFAQSNNSTAVIKGTYQFTSIEGENIQSQNTFEYRDECFTRSSFIGCKELEMLSIQAASASGSYYGPENDNDEIDTSVCAHNITEMLNKMKFKDVSTNKYYTTEKRENSIGVAVGHKNIIQDGKHIHYLL